MKDSYKTSGIQVIHRFRNGTKITGMAVFYDKLYISTTKGIYVKEDPDAKLKKVKS